MNTESARIFGCIQVRLGSQRLPGKALAEIEGRSVLEWIISRLRHCQQLTGIIVSTTDMKKDDMLKETADNLQVPCFRGSETDLIQRLLGTADSVKADAIARITGDCPLVDFQLVDRAACLYRERQGDADIVTNIFPPTFPDGLDIEILPLTTLERLDEEVKDSLHREWFTSYIYRHPEAFRILNISDKEDVSDYRLTLDYPEDLECIRKICSYFKETGGTFTLEQILGYLKQCPEVMGINRHRTDKISQGIRAQAYFNLKKEQDEK